MDSIFGSAYNSILSGDNATSLANLVSSRILAKPAPANAEQNLTAVIGGTTTNAGGVSFGSGQISGGISYTNPTKDGGGGFQFDLPLSAAQTMTNQAYAFAQNNTRGTQSFLSGVISGQQNQINNAMSQGYSFNSMLVTQTSDLTTQLMAHNEKLFKRQKSSGCFITTAICRDSGLPDNCEYLETFRKFRDEHVPANEVAAYYEIAPKIVATIEASESCTAILAYLRDGYLMPAFEAIKSGDNEKAHSIYKRMVYVASVLV